MYNISEHKGGNVQNLVNMISFPKSRPYIAYMKQKNRAKRVKEEQ